MTEQQFFEGLIALLVECDEARLKHNEEFTLGLLMDWMYPHMGSEFN